MKSAILIGEEGLLTLCGDHLQDRGWQVRAVMTRAATVRQWAAGRNLDVVDNFADLAALGRVDCLFSVTNFDVVPATVIGQAELGAFNFHDGPLPETAGLNTPSWAILNQAEQHAITWHRLTDEVDGGGVCIRRDFAVAADDSVLQLNARCFELGFECFQELIAGLESGKLETAEPVSPARYFRRADKPHYLGFVDWNQTCEQILGLVRATAYGGYRNGFASCKVLLPDGYAIASEVTQLNNEVAAAPGAVIAFDAAAIDVQAANGQLRVSGSFADSLQSGTMLPPIDAVFPDDFTRHPFGHRLDDMRWPATIERCQPQALQYLAAGSDAGSHRLDTDPLGDVASVLAAVALVLARMNDTSHAQLLVSDPRLRRLSGALHGALLPWAPLAVSVDQSASALRAACEQQLATLTNCEPIPSELFVRIPAIQARQASFEKPQSVLYLLDDESELDSLPRSSTQTSIAYCQRKQSLYLLATTSQAGVASMTRWIKSADLLLKQDIQLATESLADAQDADLTQRINQAAATEHQPQPTHQMLRQHAVGSAESTALSWRGEQCSYQRLLDSADAVTAHLLAAGLPERALIGVMLTDRIQAVSTMLGIWQAGLAYVPLDPDYPSDRLSYIADDAKLALVFASATTAARHSLTVTTLDPATLPVASINDDQRIYDPARRAYVIYTSGSTGKPKGVQVSHANVANFLHGMDGVLEPGRTMLSVTSISFDISVLEIWWSLTRGLKVVFYDEQDTVGSAAKAEDSIGFSLYFWNTQDPEAPSTVAETYDLLRQAVSFADDNEFEAVWSPERHFGSFGGPFPNPAVTSAALAAMTKRIQIRAGSCVMPLHHPIRVAEDWAMIDNLSNGRVGISFASGWMPRDFVLAPDNHANSKQVMFDGIEQVRALWRGESVTFPGPSGDEEIQTLPRPVQAELPSWLTTAGSPDTFAQAGELGLNVLTHLLGQSIEELAEKIQSYRAAREKAGHQGPGHVTLMLHTFVTTDKDTAREIARGPMKAYLRSAMFLVKAAAWDFPTFKKMSEDQKQDMDGFFANMTEEDMDDLLEFAFQRYFEQSGLFGSPQDNLAQVEKLKAIGVNEIGCLIDFGIRPSEVLTNLPHLNELRALTSNRVGNSLAQIVEHCDITHLQCTPSQASMFGLDESDSSGLAAVDNLLLGGEALGQTLADSLAERRSGQTVNLYGPTETTVWSLSKPVRAGEPVEIGLPIANTTVHILDSARRPVPAGWPGELYIGGAGVSLGYLDRPELDEERFIQHAGERLYATGDTVRMRADGNVVFLGRNDHQVKIRGYRIELGEVEAVLQQLPEVGEAVVAGEQDQWGAEQLVAYFTGQRAVQPKTMRDHLRRFLPEFMVPSKFVQLKSMPRTLNDKVDRSGLAAAARFSAPVSANEQAPSTARPRSGGGSKLQRELAEIWQQLLELDSIDINANFFDLGGHSILAVRMQGMLAKKFGGRIPISELFRYPTIAGLASYLESTQGDDPSTAKKDFGQQASSRGARRRARYRR